MCNYSCFFFTTLLFVSYSLSTLCLALENADSLALSYLVGKGIICAYMLVDLTPLMLKKD